MYLTDNFIKAKADLRLLILSQIIYQELKRLIQKPKIHVYNARNIKPRIYFSEKKSEPVDKPTYLPLTKFVGFQSWYLSSIEIRRSSKMRVTSFGILFLARLPLNQTSSRLPPAIHISTFARPFQQYSNATNKSANKIYTSLSSANT